MAETEFKDIKLEAISFRGAPTESQLANALHDIKVFLNKSFGAMLLEGLTEINNPKAISTANAIGHVTAAEAGWKGESGLAVPQQGQRPQMVPRG